MQNFSFLPISHCRICKNSTLADILSLGEQCLTGISPRNASEQMSRAPLELVKCHGEGACNLVQLRHSVDIHALYGSNYDCRFSLNPSLVQHLKWKSEKLSQLTSLARKDLVLDIGSHDGTLLSFYPSFVQRVGIDPAIAKFGHYYAPQICTIPTFYSAKNFRNQFGNQKAKIVTSIAALFCGLEDPISFIREVKKVLALDGIWHFEQNYLPSLLENNSYDTICHERLEYYSLYQIQWMMDRCGLRILDVEFNLVDGGSFAITVCHPHAPYETKQETLARIVASERAARLDTLEPYEKFKKRVFAHREQLLNLLHEIRASKRPLLGYGAATQGNVMLQFCDLTNKEIPAIIEINKDHCGSYMPGTHIPIISEKAAHLLNPDFLLVMPWHFRKDFLSRKKDYLDRGGHMIFPLPSIEIIHK